MKKKTKADYELCEDHTLGAYTLVYAWGEKKGREVACCRNEDVCSSACPLFQVSAEIRVNYMVSIWCGCVEVTYEINKISAKKAFWVDEEHGSSKYEYITKYSEEEKKYEAFLPYSKDNRYKFSAPTPEEAKKGLVEVIMQLNTKG